MRKAQTVVFAAVSLLSVSTKLSAQVDSPTRTRIGAIGGVNLAKVTGNELAGDANARVAGMFGVVLLVPIRAGLDLELDALYSEKGLESPGNGSRVTLALNYLELPIMLRADLFAVSRLRFFVHAGATLSARSGCNEQIHTSAFEKHLNCTEIKDALGVSFRNTDLGIGLGGGATLSAQGALLTLGTRYTYGVTKITSSSDAKNRTMALYAGALLPLGRRSKN